MSRFRCVNSKPEVIIRSLLHRLGYRFRKNVKTLPGKPDIVLRKYNSVIFVHGCFWHKHPGCKRSANPKTNAQYWGPKLDGNVLRDEKNIRKLTDVGWKVLVVWECEVKDHMKLESILSQFLVHS